MMTQEPVKFVPKMDVLIVHLAPNVLNVIHHHITYFQEIVMKPVHLDIIQLMDYVMHVTMLVQNVMDQIQIIVTLVNINTITETHV